MSIEWVAMSQWAVYLPVLAILAAVAWIDWHQRRIPNLAVVALLLCAVFQLVVVRLGLVQGISPADVLISLGVISILLVPGYIAGVVGAGDIKLFAVLSLLLPPQIYLQAFALGITGLVVACLIVDSLTILSYRSLQHVDAERAGNTAGSELSLLNTLRLRGIPLGTAAALGTLASLG